MIGQQERGEPAIGQQKDWGYTVIGQTVLGQTGDWAKRLGDATAIGQRGLAAKTCLGIGAEGPTLILASMGPQSACAKRANK